MTVRSFGRLYRLGPILLSVSILAGCATLVHREGRALVADGKLAEGISKLKEASDLAPSRADFKQSYLLERDRLAAGLAAQGDAAAAQGNRVEAEKAYALALQLDASQPRARQGILGLQASAAHESLLSQARAALERDEFDVADALLRQVLADQPRHREAQALMRQLERRRPRMDADAALAAAYRKPVNIEFRDAPLSTVLDVISRSSGLNFIYDREFRADQRTTIKLRNSTVEAVLNVLALTQQIDWRALDSNTLMIYANTPQKAREYQPLIVKTFVLASADAKTVANTLRTMAKSKEVVVDEKLNMLIVRDNPAGIRFAERLVALHDVREAEVMLEVEVLEVARTRLMELGIQWPASIGASIAQTASPLNLLDLTQGMSGSRKDELLAGLKVTHGALAFGANFQKKDGDVNLIANPRIRVKNREKAKVVVGDRVPVVSVTGNANNSGFISESISYLDVGLKLDVEPTVFHDGDVSIKVAMEVSSIGETISTSGGSLAYRIGTRNASTILQLADGETQVLAGLISNEERTSGNKLPLLGDLPLIGRLFGSRHDEASKTEIVLAITPRIVRNVPVPDPQFGEFDSGTEANLRARTLVLSGTVPVAAKAGQAGAASVDSVGPAGAPSSADSKGGGSGPTEKTAGGSGARFNWEAPAQVRVGESFEVRLEIETKEPAATQALKISFDPAVFEVSAVQAGAAFDRLQGGAVNSRASAPGELTILAIQQRGVTKGSVVSLQMKALTAGADGALALKAADLVFTGGRREQAEALPLRPIRVVP